MFPGHPNSNLPPGSFQLTGGLWRGDSLGCSWGIPSLAFQSGHLFCGCLKGNQPDKHHFEKKKKFLAENLGSPTPGWQSLIPGLWDLLGPSSPEGGSVLWEGKVLGSLLFLDKLLARTNVGFWGVQHCGSPILAGRPHGLLALSRECGNDPFFTIQRVVSFKGTQPWVRSTTFPTDRSSKIK